MKDFCIDTIETLITDRPDVFYPVGTVQVFRQMQRDETNVSYPCIIVTETGLFPELMAGDTEKYFWMLPFNILIQDRESGSLQEAEPRYMGWHQCLMDAFRQDAPDALLFDQLVQQGSAVFRFLKPPTVNEIVQGSAGIRADIMLDRNQQLLVPRFADAAQAFLHGVVGAMANEVDGPDR